MSDDRCIAYGMTSDEHWEMAGGPSQTCPKCLFWTTGELRAHNQRLIELLREARDEWRDCLVTGKEDGKLHYHDCIAVYGYRCKCGVAERLARIDAELEKVK